MAELSTSAVFPLCTVFIKAIGDLGGSIGTGYFYAFRKDGEEGTYPVVVTNKHVIDGASDVLLAIQVFPEDASMQWDLSAPGERTFEVRISDLDDYVVRHPDPDVDLCVILIGAKLAEIAAAGLKIKHAFLDRGWHLRPLEEEMLRAAEPIRMIGYPKGLWDQVNNRPIVRQGLTASHALVCWEGKREFLVDTTVFPGSSGSPVFLYENGWIPMNHNPNGPGYIFGTGERARLLGTLWGGPAFREKGELVPKAIPSNFNAVPITEMMMNLGFVVHASALDDLITPIHQQAERLRARGISNIRTPG